MRIILFLRKGWKNREIDCFFFIIEIEDVVGEFYLKLCECVIWKFILVFVDV